jgi:hypothetical protein
MAAGRIEAGSRVTVDVEKDGSGLRISPHRAVEVDEEAA